MSICEWDLHKRIYSDMFGSYQISKTAWDTVANIWKNCLPISWLVVSQRKGEFVSVASQCGSADGNNWTKTNLQGRCFALQFSKMCFVVILKVLMEIQATCILLFPQQNILIKYAWTKWVLQQSCGNLLWIEQIQVLFSSKSCSLLGTLRRQSLHSMYWILSLTFHSMLAETLRHLCTNNARASLSLLTSSVSFMSFPTAIQSSMTWYAQPPC
jgi:hypothetical protein